MKPLDQHELNVSLANKIAVDIYVTLSLAKATQEVVKVSPGLFEGSASEKSRVLDKTKGDLINVAHIAKGEAKRWLEGERGARLSDFCTVHMESVRKFAQEKVINGL